jgi:hypothetical protein
MLIEILNVGNNSIVYRNVIGQFAANSNTTYKLIFRTLIQMVLLTLLHLLVTVITQTVILILVSVAKRSLTSNIRCI